MIDDLIDALAADGWRVYRTGDVPGSPEYPYVLVYSLQPTPIRGMVRPESARRFRFGVTVVDWSAQHIEGDADRIESLLEGSRMFGPLSRIELTARGPVTRDPEVTVGGQEVHMLPTHWVCVLTRKVGDAA